ncbi:hypothetical protein [Streptomyces sp. NPDC057617]|uniref:hypothetical protein n=1 Tax=Streptomyces sp. NPDC057617 TaxID=3346184 RepID=UPI0036B43FEC
MKDRLENPPLLASYFDLHTDRGPLHARATADLGRRYLAGEPIPPYQVVTPGQFRQAISFDFPHLAGINVPQDLPIARRSAEWNFLCAEVSCWKSMGLERKITVARVLSRLGFWATLAALPLPAGDSATGSTTLDHLRLSYGHCMARLIVGGPDPRLAAEARQLLGALAENRDFPVPVRISAAVNLVVDHARTDHSMVELLRWQNLARSLLETAPSGTLSLLMLSAYWRGISFIPFQRSDHTEAARMLDAAENYARRALAESAEERHLLVLENLRLVLMTRARAAVAAKDWESAEDFYRALTLHDPLDSKSHVLLADFFVTRGRLIQARQCYRTAARLGAPCTQYARAQADRCAAAESL